MESTELTLQQIAQMATDNNGGAKGRELDRIAKRKGLTLSYTTVNKILAGTYTSRPGIKTVEALAQLAGVPIGQAMRAAGLEAPQASLADQLPPDVDTLTAEQRRVVIDLARVFLKQNRVVHDLRQSAEVQELTERLRRNEYRLAADAGEHNIAGDELPHEP